MRLEQDDVDSRFRAIVARLEAEPPAPLPRYERGWPSAGDWLRALALMGIAPAGVWIVIALALFLSG